MKTTSRYINKLNQTSKKLIPILEEIEENEVTLPTFYNDYLISFDTLVSMLNRNGYDININKKETK